MRNVLLSFLALSVMYGCTELFGKETLAQGSGALVDTKSNQPREDLRVGRDEAQEMRKRRKSDDASVKISVKDLQALINSAPAENDSFVFYFATYNVKSDKERNRYERKVQRANWDNVGKKPSTLLVGFVSGQEANAMHLSRNLRVPVIPVYDLGVVCPPPPNCGCEIAQ